jgi:hypothetical protein
MINSALSLVTGQLNQHLRRVFQAPEDLVVLSNILEINGSAVPQAANKLVIFLVAVEQETRAHRAEGQRLNSQGQIRNQDPIYLNLYAMCAANFSGGNYPEALKFISGAIRFIHERPVLDRHNTPDLDPGLDRLTLTLESLDRSEMQNVWSLHGGRYLPSVLFRVGMVSLDAQQASGRERPVGRIDPRMLGGRG